jgi:hypothetical protein
MVTRCLRLLNLFENGDFCDIGPTRRRHVQATQINYIGKEANRWEEQFFLGMDEDAAIEYGADPNAPALFDELMVVAGKIGKPQLASHIGISRNSLTKILDMKCQNLSPIGMIMGLIEPTTGLIHVFGHDMAHEALPCARPHEFREPLRGYAASPYRAAKSARLR